MSKTLKFEKDNQHTMLSSAFKGASRTRRAARARLKQLVTHHREVHNAQAYRMER